MIRRTILISLTLLSSTMAQEPTKAPPIPADKIEFAEQPYNDVPEVIVYTRAENCPPCDRWMQTELPKAIKAKLKVLIVPVDHGETPRYRLQKVGQRSIVHRAGFLSAEVIRGLLGK